MEKEKAVEFSARSVELINYCNVERHDTQRDLKVFQQRYTYYVQNKCNSCRKLRVALGESSHSVSSSITSSAYAPLLYTLLYALHI